MDAEERAALERELAAALAVLSGDGDEEEEPIVDDATPYQRLDIEMVLRQTAEAVDSAYKTGDRVAATSTWELFLEQVEERDAEYFDVIEHDLEELKTKFQLPEQIRVHRHVLIDGDNQQDQDHSVITAEVAGEELEDGSANTKPSNISQESNASKADMTSLQLTYPYNGLKSLLDVEDDGQGKKEDDKSHGEALTRPEPGENHENPKVLAEVDDLVSEGDEEKAKQAAEAAKAIERAIELQMEEQREAIKAQRLAQQHRMERTQALRQREKEQQAEWVRAMELALVAQEVQEQRRKEDQRERGERSEMERNEHQQRRIFELQRLRRERAHMDLEDQTSTTWRRWTEEERTREHTTTLAMMHEERSERERLRMVLEQALQEEHTRLVRCQAIVLEQLVQTHATRQAMRVKEQDLLRRQEIRETSLMRAEELRQRRYLAQCKAIEEDTRRQLTRAGMTAEDARGQLWRSEERERTRLKIDRLLVVFEDQRSQQRRERERAEDAMSAVERKQMQHEDVASMAWREAWKQEQIAQHRHSVLSVLVHGCIRRILLRAWSCWFQRTRVLLLRDSTAARWIQRVWQKRQARIALAKSKQQSEAESSAAMVVQSAFRGFHIRRKFLNALDMAAQMDSGNVLDEFGEVELDEWLQAPPELEDGWENPVLPSIDKALVIQRRAMAQAHRDHRNEDDSTNEDDTEEEEEEEDDDDGDNEEPQYDGENRDIHVQQQAHSSSPASLASTTARSQLSSGTAKRPVQPARSEPQQLMKEWGLSDSNLASTLWKRMKKAQQRKNAAAERAKDQDPTYRVQKLLRKRGGPSATCSAALVKTPSNQTADHGPHAQDTVPMVTWSSSAHSDKKKTKVKLPSLVERLRKKTAAAR